jgi:hypothetical protein
MPRDTKTNDEEEAARRLCYPGVVAARKNEPSYKEEKRR